MILGSRSPQRRAILEMLGVDFEQVPVQVDELEAGEPRKLVLENALRKARTAATTRESGRLVLGVDTEVYLDGQIFGKPRDADEARSHLERLSGRAHEVFSGLALLQDAAECTGVARTVVRFRALDDDLLAWYLESGEWHGRAGAYAVQGKGAALVAGIEGDYWNVVGLPVPLLLETAPALLHG